MAEYSEVKCLWDTMLFAYDLAGLAQRAQFQDENTRETLIKLRPIWVQDANSLSNVEEVVQILTVLANMTFHVQMGGQINEGSTWVEASDCAGPVAPQKPSSLEERLSVFTRSDEGKTMLITELERSVQELGVLSGQAEVSAVWAIQRKFNFVQSLLQEALHIVRRAEAQ